MPTETKSCLFTFVQIRLCVIDVVFVCLRCSKIIGRKEKWEILRYGNLYVRAPRVCFSK